ncbi:MAG: hypothetical protein HFH02_05915 [Dorea sp.]|nr:hypothetical protein [Dorea sp.]
MKENQDKKIFYKRIGMTVFGVVLNGASVGFFRLAAFGVDPFQSLMSGLDFAVPLRFGTLYVVANIFLLMFGLFADRHYIGLGTMINLFLLGYIVEFSHSFLIRAFPAPSLGFRIVSFLIGVGVMCFSSAFYFTADMGVSTYDAVALILANKWHVGRFKFIRIITDFVCVAAGCGLYLISGGELSKLLQIAGIGTVITAFFMGPLIDFFNRQAAEPFLYGERKEKR